MLKGDFDNKDLINNIELANQMIGGIDKALEKAYEGVETIKDPGFKKWLSSSIKDFQSGKLKMKDIEKFQNEMIKRGLEYKKKMDDLDKNKDSEDKNKTNK